MSSNAVIVCVTQINLVSPGFCQSKFGELASMDLYCFLQSYLILK